MWQKVAKHVIDDLRKDASDPTVDVDFALNGVLLLLGVSSSYDACVMMFKENLSQVIQMLHTTQLGGNDVARERMKQLDSRVDAARERMEAIKDSVIA